MRQLALLFAAALCLAPARAQEIDIFANPFHEPKELVPEASFFERHNIGDAVHGFVVTREFADFVDKSFFAAMIAHEIEPGGASETAFAVRVDFGPGGDKVLVGLERTLPIPKVRWDGSLEQLASLHREGPARRCEIPIDEARSRRIENLWSVMVQATHTPRGAVEREGDYDTTTFLPLEYHFIDDDGNAARAVRPASHLKPGVMAALGTAMFDYCMTKKPDALSRMDAKLVELEGLLAKEGAKP